MDPHSYTNADPTFGPGRVYAPIDPLGETATNFTVYTLVYRSPLRQRGAGAMIRNLKEKLTNQEDNRKTPPGLHRLPKNENDTKHLSDQDVLDLEETREIKLKYDAFYNIAEELKCICLKPVWAKKCTRGCYLQEWGNEEPGWKCTNTKCKGHRYWQPELPNTCFEVKGVRLVRIDHLLDPAILADVRMESCKKLVEIRMKEIDPAARGNTRTGTSGGSVYNLSYVILLRRR
ncbi:hypothetical protein B0J11DRAFT_504893 [Dendryphion nanum]|uniref:Uncharacterized protein n=1 Tax=Dendryphion nanum TaxID=256645 RepID=A0A9P9E0A6_9PLEO|nr:hypothetical protein B0J11DRAFT_504893 [Dendryphion nanum]